MDNKQHNDMMMETIRQYIPLCQSTIDWALAHGCSDCKMTLATYEGTKIDMMNGELDTLKHSCSNGLLIRLYLPDGRSNVVSTNRLDAQELQSLVAQGIETARLLAPDTDRSLPDLERCYQPKPGDDLDQTDALFHKHTTEEKMALARAVSNTLKGRDCVMNRVIFSDSFAQELYIASNGLQLSAIGTQSTVTAMVTLKGIGDDRPDGYDYCQRITFDELKRDTMNVALSAWKKADAQRAERVPAQGEMKVVVDTNCVLQLLEPLLDSISGSAIWQRNSFLIKKQGKTIGSPLLTLVDEPHRKHTLGARYFDSEGLATRRRTIFNQGVLRTYYVNSYHAKKLNLKPTADEASVLVMPHGDTTLADLMKQANGGLYITDFIGGNCNLATGDFSFGIMGFTIKNGKADKPIVGQNISGNMLEFWHHLAAVANDINPYSSVQIPSLLFNNITIA